MPDLRNYVISVKTNSYNPDNFQVFFNRSDQCLHVHPKSQVSEYDLFIFDITGKLHCTRLNNIEQVSLPFPSVKTGIYLVKIVTSKSSHSYKVIR